MRRSLKYGAGKSNDGMEEWRNEGGGGWVGGQALRGLVSFRPPARFIESTLMNMRFHSHQTVRMQHLGNLIESFPSIPIRGAI